MFLFCLVFAMSLCASVYMCFVVTCWKRADLLQGRRRVLKSGPAEEIIECRWHERGRAREGTPPLVRGLGGLSRENFEFLALLCAFLM